MKQFLTRLLCFLIILGTLLLLIGNRYHKASPIAQELQVPLEAMPQSIDLAVVGSSHALFGMDLSAYTENYFNFSMAGQTPQYDYAMLKQYEGRIADGATVLMSVSYISPFWTDSQDRFLEKQTRYYRILDRENMVDYDWAEAFRVALTTAIPQTRIFFTDFSNLIHALKSYSPSDEGTAPVVHIPAEALSLPEEPDIVTDATAEATPSLEQDLDPDARARKYTDPKGKVHTCIYSNDPSWFDDLDHYVNLIRREHMSIVEPSYPGMNPDMLEAYENICALAQKHNWRLIAVTVPFTRPYNDMFDAEFYEIFYDYMDQLTKKHGIEYWDYSHDLRFVDSPDYFEDLDHLIYDGKRLFSALLAQRLGLNP